TPRPRLFPYTTLFRSRPRHRPTARLLLPPSPAPRLVVSHARDPRPTTPARVPHLRAHHLALVATALRVGVIRGRRRQRDDPPPRSEEHTSELQSRENI